MAIKGISVAYCAVGGIVLFSGIKGATISDTVKGVLSGNIASIQSTEAIAVDNGSSSGSNGGSPGSSSTATSGSDNANLLTIAKYMQSNGYSRAAAAGIAGCIAGESGGDPESVGTGGNGLIGWTPPKPGIVTGNSTKDLQAQLPLIIQYNNAIGAQYISMLNQISDPVQAADFYSENFEKPKYKDSDVRASVAQSVYSQLGSS